MEIIINIKKKNEFMLTLKECVIMSLIDEKIANNDDTILKMSSIVDLDDEKDIYNILDKLSDSGLIRISKNYINSTDKWNSYVNNEEQMSLFGAKESSKNDIESIYAAIMKNEFAWRDNIIISKPKRNRTDLRDKYIHIIDWWLSNFTKESILDIQKEYNNTLFVNIKNDYMKWIRTGTDTFRSEPLKTLNVFFKKKVDDVEYSRENPELILSRIENDTEYEWEEHIHISAYKGSKQSYIDVIEKWLLLMPESKRIELRRESNIDDLSSMLENFFVYATTSEKRVTNPYKTLRRFLKI